MPNDRLHPRRPDGPDMSADAIAGRRFGQSWRGFDADEVKQFLAQVAAQVRSLRERYDQAEAARREAEQRASHPQLDEATLMSAVGEETAGILRSARSAAAEITAKAEANAQAIVAAADAKAAELVAEAESLLATRTAEADSVATEIREHALAEAEHVRGLAQQQGAAMAAEAAKKADETVQAAQAVREKILTDLARRRKLGTVQVEQLRAGRERLLDAYLVVRRTLDEVTDELQRADAEARAAADAAGRHHGPEADELLDLRAEEAWATPAPGGPRVAEASVPPGLSEPVRPLVAAPKGPAAAKAGLAGDVGTPTAPSGADEPSAIVTRTDAIESVRILRESPVGNDVAPEASDATDPGPAGPAAPQHDVDDLFARIRASRAEATISARTALYDTPSEGTGSRGPQAEGRAPDAGPEPEIDVDALGGAPGANGSSGPPSSLGQFFTQRDEVIGRLEGSLARKLKRALQDEQNSLLDRLRGQKGPVKPGDVLPTAEEQPDRFLEAGRPVLEAAARAGSELAATIFPSTVVTSHLDPEVIDDLAEELGRAIAEPLRQRLEAAFRVADGDPGDVAEALGPAYREWKTQRIEATARDQVAAAFARGAYLAFADDTVLAWLASPAQEPCADCEDNALAGQQRKGDSWPTGQLYPPAHPGCQCALAPAGADEPVAETAAAAVSGASAS